MIHYAVWFILCQCSITFSSSYILHLHGSCGGSFCVWASRCKYDGDHGWVYPDREFNAVCLPYLKMHHLLQMTQTIYLQNQPSVQSAGVFMFELM